MKTYQIGKWQCLTALELPYPMCEHEIASNCCYIYKDESLKTPALMPYSPTIHAVIESGIKGIYQGDAPQENGMAALNISHFKNEDVLNAIAFLERWETLMQKKKRVHLLGLGDVGATLAIGLKLLSQGEIETLGLYDLNPNAIKRWEMELNQVIDTTMQVEGITEDQLFDCDVFVFCASKYVPKVGEQVGDVRMAQYQENAGLMEIYGKKARESGFKGLFLVVSDPVDLLCKKLYHASNLDCNGRWDGEGLIPDQIRGYGLGVMHGRALYYSKQMQYDYEEKGRVFGPHGKALVVIENVEKFSAERSKTLTEKVTTANLEMRALGYKPYIAPALSSGAQSILQTLRGEYHYSATYLNGIFWGTKQSMTQNGSVYESLRLTDEVWQVVSGACTYLEETWEKLNS